MLWLHRLRGQQFPGQNFIQGRAEKDHFQRIEHRFARQALRQGRRCWRRFSPGAANPLLVGTLLRFRSTNPDRFCEEFRPYYIEVLKASAGELDDKDLKILESLQNPENFPCEQTGHEIVAQRDCRILPICCTFGILDVSYLSILRWPRSYKVRINPPQGLVLRLDAIKVEPQPSSLFIPLPDHIVLARLKKRGRVPPE